MFIIVKIAGENPSLTWDKTPCIICKYVEYGPGFLSKIGFLECVLTLILPNDSENRVNMDEKALKWE